MLVLCVPKNHDSHLFENYTLTIIKPIERKTKIEKADQAPVL